MQNKHFFVAVALWGHVATLSQPRPCGPKATALFLLAAEVEGDMAPEWVKNWRRHHEAQARAPPVPQVPQPPPGLVLSSRTPWAAVTASPPSENRSCAAPAVPPEPEATTCAAQPRCQHFCRALLLSPHPQRPRPSLPRQRRQQLRGPLGGRTATAPPSSHIHGRNTAPQVQPTSRA